MDCGLSFTTLNGVDIVTRFERRDKLVPNFIPAGAFPGSHYERAKFSYLKKTSPLMRGLYQC